MPFDPVLDFERGTSDPDAPKDFTATFTPSQIDLAWTNAQPDYTSIIIQRMDNIGSPWTQLTSIAGSLEAYTDSVGLQEGVIYTYRLSAILADGVTQTGWSVTASAVSPIAEPTLFSLAIIDEDSVSGSWTLNSTIEDVVEVIWSGDDGSMGVNAYPPGTTFATNIEPLVPGILYTSKVRVRRGSVNSLWSNEDSITTTVNPPLSVTATAISPTVVEVGWQDDSKFESGFEVGRDGQVIATLPAGSTIYSDTTAVGSTTYTYSVRTLSAGAPSVWVDALDVTTPAPPATPPAPPAFVKSVTIASDQLDVTWVDSSSDEDGFIVYRRLITGV